MTLEATYLEHCIVSNGLRKPLIEFKKVKESSCNGVTERRKREKEMPTTLRVRYAFHINGYYNTT